MSLEPKYEKPTYPGTGNGLSGDSGDYDVIVIGSGMGGLACGALSAKYGDRVLVLESHIKCGGSAHTFSRMHKGEKYSFEVGPSIFEGLDRPSLNPLRMIFDVLDEPMPVKTYTGLGYWTPNNGYWRFPIGSKSAFEQLLMEQAEDGPKAIQVSLGGWCVLVSVLVIWLVIWIVPVAGPTSCVVSEPPCLTLFVLSFWVSAIGLQRPIPCGPPNPV